MKNVREKGCPEVNWSKISPIYANNGPGKTGSREPMIAIIQSMAQRMMRTISIL